MSAGRIFITGANGYVGTSILNIALKQGYSVVGLTRSEEGAAKIRARGATAIVGDLSSLDVLARESAAADVVIHLADPFLGSHFTLPYDEVIAIENAAVEAMATPLKGTNKPLLITTGTLSVAADPNGGETTEESPLEPNPLVKRIVIEKSHLSWAAKGVRVIAIRLAPFVYGLGGSLVGMLMKMQYPSGALTNIVAPDGKPKQTSVVHVDDAARLYLLAAEKAKAGDVFNVTSSTTLTIQEILEATAKTLQVPIVNLPYDEALSKVGEFFAKFLVAANRASSAKAVKELRWKPKEIGILEDITSGSYVAVAEEIRKGASS